MVADVDGAYGENFWLCGDAALHAATLTVRRLHGLLKGAGGDGARVHVRQWR